MRTIHEATGALFRDVMIGGSLGLVILGVGGRVAMRMVAVALGQPPMFDAEGTLTVVLSGGAAGAAGALIHALCRAVAGLLAGGAKLKEGSRRGWPGVLRLTMFATLLALVTARGLSGSPGPTWMFWLLVAMYGAAYEAALEWRARKAARVSGEPLAKALFTGALLAAVLGCSLERPRAAGDSAVATPTRPDPETAFRDQLGQTWELARLGTQDIPETRRSTTPRSRGSHPGSGTRPTIQFTAERAESAQPDSGLFRAGGWSFCNGYGAAYRAGPGDALRFTMFQSTLVGCDGPDSLESRYFRALGDTRRIAVDSTSLQLIAADGTSLTFVPAPDSAGPPLR